MSGLDISICKEEFSVAYVHSLLSVAGLSLQRITVDHHGVDFTIRDTPMAVDVQIKATSTARDRSQPLQFALDVRTYHILTDPTRNVPAYLFVVEVPDEQDRWATVTRTGTQLKHHGYFRSMAGLPPTKNKSTVTVTLPRENRITASALQHIMAMVRSGT